MKQIIILFNFLFFKVQEENVSITFKVVDTKGKTVPAFIEIYSLPDTIKIKEHYTVKGFNMEIPKGNYWISIKECRQSSINLIADRPKTTIVVVDNDCLP